MTALAILLAGALLGAGIVAILANRRLDALKAEYEDALEEETHKAYERGQDDAAAAAALSFVDPRGITGKVLRSMGVGGRR